MKYILLIFTFLILCFSGLAFKFIFSSAGSDSQSVSFEVPLHTSTRGVAEALFKKNLISNSTQFYFLARLTGVKIKRGEYGIAQNMRPLEILSVLSSGKSITRPFIVPEGYNKYDIAAEFEAQNYGTRAQFLNASKDPQLIKSLLGESAQSLEGYLYPETYMITKFATAPELITLMVKNFMRVYSELTANQKIPWTRAQLVTLASVVEKETGAPEERPLIASIFINRLRLGMKLQSDPTIIYGMMEESGKPVENIHHADILRPTPFNTYTVKALPIGPISNPGRQALNAVLHPATSDFLYFVSRNDGTHVFSKTYADHSSAVRKFQIDPAARVGKSWRDLNKRTTQ